MSGRLGRLEGAMRWMMWRLGDRTRRKGKAKPAGRHSRLDEDLKTIAESPLFDAAFYVARHPGVATSGLTPYEHYLRKGAKRNLKPSAGFDPEAYLAAHPDAAGENPILHFHRTGQVAPSSGEAPGDGFPIVARPEGEPDRRRRTTVPRESFGDPFAAARDEARVVLRAFRRLSGLPLPPGDCDAGGVSLDGLRAAGAWLREGPCRLDDAWHLDGGARLRLRFAGSEDGRRPRHVAAFQAGAGNQKDGTPELVPVGEAIVGEGPVFADLVLAEPLMPVLVLLRPASGARPGDAEAAVLPFPSLLRGGLHYAELAAAVPRLTTIAEAFARWDEALHALLAPSAAPFAVGCIALAPGAAGLVAEGALARWLCTVFGVAVGEAATPSEGRAGAGVLVLPSDAVPTLSALLARDAGACVRSGPFLVADPATRAPRHAVTLPAATAALLELQPHGAEPLPVLSADGAATGPAGDATAFPLAIRFRAPAGEDASPAPAAPRLKRPFDPASLAAGDLVVVLVSQDADRTANLLEDLCAQTVASLAEIRLAPLRPEAVEGPAAEVASRFGERCRIADPVGPALADRLAGARAAGGRLVLLVSDAVVLPDPRTLETLAVLAGAEGVGAASCLLAERSFSGHRAGPAVACGGWFPAGVSFLTAPAVTFARPDVLGALSGTTCPVVAAGPEIVLFRAEALADLDGIVPNPVGDAALLQLALANAAAGKAHLVTTAVRALCLDPVARRDVPDPAGPGAIPPRRLLEIVDGVTMVREVKG